MRVSVALFLLSLAGMLVGAHMVGQWCVGLVLIVWSGAVGAFALLRDTPGPVGQADMVGSREAVRLKAWQSA